MANYDRYVHIILRDGVVRAVISGHTAAMKALNDMRDHSMPKFDPDEDYDKYMASCNDEHFKWRLERWPILKGVK